VPCGPVRPGLRGVHETGELEPVKAVQREMHQLCAVDPFRCPRGAIDLVEPPGEVAAQPRAYHGDGDGLAGVDQRPADGGRMIGSHQKEKLAAAEKGFDHPADAPSSASMTDCLRQGFLAWAAAYGALVLTWMKSYS